MKTQPKEIARQYAEAVWNEKNLKAIERLVHDRVHIHSLLGDYSGKFAMQQVVETWLTAFPNLQVKEEQVMAEGDLVSIQWQAQGTHQGPFKGYEPTGKRVHYKGTTVYRIQDGLIVEYWAYLDMQFLLQQLVNSFTNLQFETERLRIRSIRSDDARLIQSFNERNSKHLAPWETVNTNDCVPCERWFRECLEGAAARFLLFQKSDPSKLIGLCNFTNVVHGPFKACYLGYKLDASCEGKGLMREALTRTIDYMFNEVGMHRIMANYNPANQRSANLLKQLGFIIEGTAKDYLMINGKWEDHVLTSLTKGT